VGAKQKDTNFRVLFVFPLRSHQSVCKQTCWFLLRSHPREPPKLTSCISGNPCRRIVV